MSKVRGTSFLGTIDYVRGKFGAEALARVLRDLPPELRAWLGRGGPALLPAGWYEASALSTLTRAIDRTLGANDLSLARDIGRHVAFSDVNRFFKWLFRLAGPKMLFARSASVWSNYYDDGRYVFEGAADGQASIRVEEWAAADDVLCRRLEGWIARAFELASGLSVQPTIRETHHCARDARITPARFCRFEARW
jgi:hypothetical protein